MKKLLTIFLLLTCGINYAQNLVPNGDFEQFWHCPTDYSQIDSAKFWLNPCDWSSPDYWNQCAPDTVLYPANVPHTSLGFQQANSGGAFAGIYLWDNLINYREYIEVPLISSLTNNVCYHFEMQINLSNTMQYTCDNIGVYFSDTLVTDGDTFWNLPLIPQINNSLGNVPDTLNWILVSGDYTALGGESYLVIGNFSDDISTNSTKINPTGKWDRAYVYIDDVSLTSCFPIGIKERNEIDKTIFPNPVKDILNVQLNNNESSEIIIYDLSSRKLLLQTFSNTTTVNTESLAKGIYFYEVRNRDVIIKYGKVIKE